MANKLQGKIIRINADRSGALIALDNDPNLGPLENHFRLELEHSNYNALYSLALTAAANRLAVTIVAAGDADLSPTIEAQVRNIAVVWVRGRIDD
jgi:hypothetical protein